MKNSNDNNIGRRNFLKGSLAAGASTLVMPSLFGSELSQIKGSADIVVRNAKVTTINPDIPSAEAFAIKDGRYYRVGSNNAVSELIGRNTKVIDAKNHRIIPGLNDSHTHGVREGLHYGLELRWDWVSSEEALAMLAEEVSIPQKDNGYGW